MPRLLRFALPAEYGVYALAGSVLLTMMGVSLMFEKNLIRLGNVRAVILYVVVGRVEEYTLPTGHDLQ